MAEVETPEQHYIEPREPQFKNRLGYRSPDGKADRLFNPEVRVSTGYQPVQ